MNGNKFFEIHKTTYKKTEHVGIPIKYQKIQTINQTVLNSGENPYFGLSKICPTRQEARWGKPHTMSTLIQSVNLGRKAISSGKPSDPIENVFSRTDAYETGGASVHNHSLMTVRTFSSILSILFILFVFGSCQKETDSASVRKARESLQSSIPSNPSFDQATPPSALPPITPAGSAPGGVSHYICPNNCEGSGGEAQGNCPVCGTAYAHNAAYHNQGTTPGTTPPPPAPNPEANAPATNAAGVYHYICSAGCAGGAGASGNCTSCGATLTHNAAYHQ